MIDRHIVTAFDHTTFSTYFPLPFRIWFLLVLGFWLCATNFHYFHLSGVDISPLIQYTPRTHDRPLHSSIYQLSLTLTVIWAAGIVVFWHVTSGIPEEAERWSALAMATGGVIICAIIWPGGHFYARGRTRLIGMFKRVLVGGLDRDLRFADVLLSDVIISYAKTLGDVYILICINFLATNNATTARPDRTCGGSLAVAFIMSIPSLIRLRQCFTDYFRAKELWASQGRSGGLLDAKVHLWNAGKYASVFPVILFSAMQREWAHDQEGDHILTKEAISRLWLASVFINSFFSFYWDVTQDWGLPIPFFFSSSSPFPPSHLPNSGFTSKPRTPPQMPPYHSIYLYHGAILLDFFLRCSWSLKLSPHLDYVDDLEGGIFLFQLVELLRRWMWVFFRVEREWTGLNAERQIQLDEWRKEKQERAKTGV